MTLRATALAHLLRAPRRFRFDAAVRLLLLRAGSANPHQAIRFVSPPHLAYPVAEILAVSAPPGAEAEVETTIMGLVGPSGVLPHGYSDLVSLTERGRAPSLHAFLDLLAQRFVAMFAEAGIKYRPHRAAEAARLDGRPDTLRRAVLALAGHMDETPPARLACGAMPLLHYAGLFAAFPRSSDRLEAMVADWLRLPVHLQQFAGAWLDVPPPERTTLPSGANGGQYCRLGVDAAAGVRFWDVQAGIVLRIGPLRTQSFVALLPGGALFAALSDLVRAYLGTTTLVVINLVVARDAVPALQLGPAASLGWNTWLHAAHRPHDASEPRFAIRAATS